MKVKVYGFPNEDIRKPATERDWELVAVWEDGEWIEGDMPSVPDDADAEEILNMFDGPTLLAFTDPPNYVDS